MEHFSFHSGEREDREVNNHDDQFAEHGGLADFLGAFENGFEAFFDGEQATQAVLRFRETPDAVFHDDHRAIDDDAEIQCAETHEVS